MPTTSQQFAFFTRIKATFILSVFSACLCMSHASSAQTDNALTHCGEAGAAKEIAAGVYVRQGHHAPPFTADNLANIGFVVGEQCVAVVDTGTSIEEGEALLCAIKAITSLPVCYVILTHHHFDHVMGSKVFNTGGDKTPSFVAHAKLPGALQQSDEYYRTELSSVAGQLLPPDHVVLPDQLVHPGEPLSIDLGGRTLSLIAHPPAHTNNDLSIMDDKTATLWLSDLLFVEHIPALDSGLGSINGWIDVMTTLTAPVG